MVDRGSRDGGSLSLCGSSVKGTWREGSIAGRPVGHVEKKALETGISFHRGPLWGTWRRAHLSGTLRDGVYKEALDGLGDFNIRGQIIQTVKYADDLVIMAKEEKVLQGMIDKLIEIGSCYGME